MTALPPIIERLDAVISDQSDCPYFKGTGTCSSGCFTEPSCITDRPPEGWPKERLREELLRLQEERDAAWDSTHSALFNQSRQYRQERDALLEALKGTVAGLEGVERYLEDPYAEQDARHAAIATLRQAIANVEGKE